MADRTVTVHIDDVPLGAITDALLAIERADRAWGQRQHDRMARLVLGLREIRDGGLNGEH